MINVDRVIADQLPSLNNNALTQKPVKAILSNLLHEKDLFNFEREYPHLQGIDFVEQVLEYFDFSYSVLDKEKERIPTEGKVVIIANHPIGSLDGLALLKLVSEIRSDVKVVANEMLMAIKPLDKLLLPVNNMKGNSTTQNLSNIYSYLNAGGAVIIFPAGEVSRLRPNGIKDTHWHSGFLRIAKATKSPILPMFIDGKNSALFYSVSMVYKPLATMLLVREMFKQHHKSVNIRIGDMIVPESYLSANLPVQTSVSLFKKHLYRITSDKPGLFKTHSSIALPEDPKALKHAIEKCELLGQTQDGKDIYLYQHTDSSPILREIGRLRELTFRSVGEGTGKRRDIDKYDSYYYHLILWDKQNLEIAGAYRFGDTATIINNAETELYSQTLFKYKPQMNAYFEHGLELGRSFVQPKYWGKRSLDYLWYGIGAFVKTNPQFRYLLGPVSISNTFPPSAKNLLVHFYQQYFSPQEQLVESNLPYQISQQDADGLKDMFIDNDYKADFTKLKHLMANMGVNVPTLYKQYSELCEDDGVKFLAFGTDPEFNDCVDGLVMVDLNKLKEKKRKRYLGD
ncbi:lysophospholipid acyltransferase family protein [Pseudoalteromonas sp. C2R02]|uniref:GNAT family N-acyltransferase n=1 Tax=Pseudoalteromonas sp. C2R02 TaxID=2841565 RepID=UPI001C094EB2|nr:lysophospholipid acyltransferase family protein [Pseudoalteromonas sp. C2R02]MBU2967761.1 lysophospholipid acyltransferase family protein [Pseudoalteromonas sp. C2R02]